MHGDVSRLDSLRIGRGLPVGIAPEQDSTGLVTGLVTGIDPATRRVQVSLGTNSTPFWVPADPGIYTLQGKVRLSRSPLDGNRIVKCDGPIDRAPEIVQGTIKTVNSSTSTLTVTVLGADVNLPAASDTYAVGNTVHVLRSVQSLGEPIFVLGRQANFSGANPNGNNGGVGNGASGQQRERSISPSDSGAWRSSVGRWDQWNPDRYGGPNALWQGNNYGSGPMIGWAGYGDQIVNLGATAILSGSVTVIRSDSSNSSPAAPVVQGTANGSKPGGAPSSSGDTATGAGITLNQSTTIALPASILEGLRTGAFRGLVLVGGDYGAFYGPSRGGMQLTLQYTVSV